MAKKPTPTERSGGLFQSDKCYWTLGTKQKVYEVEVFSTSGFFCTFKYLHDYFVAIRKKAEFGYNIHITVFDKLGVEATNYQWTEHQHDTFTLLAGQRMKEAFMGYKGNWKRLPGVLQAALQKTIEDKQEQMVLDLSDGY